MLPLNWDLCVWFVVQNLSVLKTGKTVKKESINRNLINEPSRQNDSEFLKEV